MIEEQAGGFLQVGAGQDDLDLGAELAAHGHEVVDGRLGQGGQLLLLAFDDAGQAERADADQQDDEAGMANELTAPVRLHDDHSGVSGQSAGQSITAVGCGEAAQGGGGLEPDAILMREDGRVKQLSTFEPFSRDPAGERGRHGSSRKIECRGACAPLIPRRKNGMHCAASLPPRAHWRGSFDASPDSSVGHSKVDYLMMDKQCIAGAVASSM